MNKPQRFGAFLLGCIPLRIVISVLPLYLDKAWLPYYGGLIFIMSMSFLYLYFGKLRLNAFEAGGQTWWSEYLIKLNMGRNCLIHGLLYLAGSIYLFQQKRTAYLPLAIDVLVGLGLFIRHHLQQGDFVSL